MLSISLEIARGLAALWVLIYHLRFGLAPGLFRRFADAGFLGVPAFFVISGYCMMASSRAVIARQQSSATFLGRRLRRIFPPYWASILVALAVPFAAPVISVCRGGAFHWPTLHWAQFSPIDWLTLATLTRGLANTGAAHLPYKAVNAVYWSLAIEIQFYLAMYLALVFRRTFNAFLIALTMGCVAFWMIKGPIAPGLFPEYWPMFALGLLLYTVLEKGIRPSRFFGNWTYAMSGLAFAGMLAAALALTICFPSESLARQTLFAMFCGLALWACGGVEPSVPKHLLASRALTGLGKMSYSVYLLHLQLVSFVTMLVAPFVPGTSRISFVLAVLGTLLLSYIFYLFCEKPFIGAGQKPNPNSRRFALIRG